MSFHTHHTHTQHQSNFSVLYTRPPGIKAKGDSFAGWHVDNNNNSDETDGADDNSKLGTTLAIHGENESLLVQ